jgi:hypothetical protein
MVMVIEDKDGGVRDAALNTMGILKGRYGDSIMDKYLSKLNKQKQEKIAEAAKEVQPSRYDRPENWKPPKPKAKPAPAPAAKPKSKPKAAVVEDDEDEDALMNFDNAPPKRKPPNIGKKPPSRKKKVESDEEMSEEEKAPAKPPPKKAAPAAKKEAPALSSDKPKKAPTTGKAIAAPVVKDEDIGAGLSKEDAID